MCWDLNDGCKLNADHITFSSPSSPLHSGAECGIASGCGRRGGCASLGVACNRRELLHIWLHLFFYSFEKLKDLFLSSVRLRFLLFFDSCCPPANVFRLSRFSLPVCQCVSRGLAFAALSLLGGVKPTQGTVGCPTSKRVLRTAWTIEPDAIESVYRWYIQYNAILLIIPHLFVLCLFRKTLLWLWFSMDACWASQNRNYPAKVLKIQKILQTAQFNLSIQRVQIEKDSQLVHNNCKTQTN